MRQFFKSVFASMLGTILAFSFVFLGFITLVVSLQSAMRFMARPKVTMAKQNVLYLLVDGPIVENKHRRGMFLRSFGSRDRSVGLYESVQALQNAKFDDDIKGLVLEVRGEQSGYASLKALSRAILDFSSSGKFVIAYSESMSEGGYYLASNANKVYLYPEADFELNGFSAVMPFFKGALDKLEIKPEVFRVGKFKSAIEPFILTKMSDENREQYQLLLQDLWADFAQQVSANLSISEELINQIGEKLEVISAQDAHKKNLVHALKSSEEGLKEIRGLLNAEADSDYKIPWLDLEDYYHLKVAQKDMGIKDAIAVLSLEGEIVLGMGGRDGEVGSDEILEALREVRHDQHVKAVVLRINSPGGSALASDIIWQEVQVLAETKPVYASFGDVAASGGYYVAAGAKKIFAESTTITGSIGVFGLMLNTSQFMQSKLGVTFDRVVTHPSADLGSSVRNLTDLERQSIQRSVESVYEKFLFVVGNGRGIKDRHQLESLAEGRIWSGKRAQELKLVDELGGLDAAIVAVAKEAGVDKYAVEFLPRAKDPFVELLKNVEEFSSEGLAKMLFDAEDVSTFLQLKKLRKDSGVYTRLPVDVQIQ